MMAEKAKEISNITHFHGFAGFERKMLAKGRNLCYNNIAV